MSSDAARVVKVYLFLPIFVPGSFLVFCCVAFTIVSPAWDYTSLIPFEFPGWNFSILEPLAIERKLRTNSETEVSYATNII